MPETVLDGRTGLLVSPDDPEQLATAIGGLLADPRRAIDMGEEARRHATRFDISSCVDAYAGVYRRLGAAGPEAIGVESRTKVTTRG